MPKPKQHAATHIPAAATARTPRAAAATASLRIATMKPNSSSSPSGAAPTVGGGNNSHRALQLPVAAQSDPELFALLHHLQNRAETALRGKIKQVDAEVEGVIQDCARGAQAIVADVDQQRAELDARHRQIWDGLDVRAADAHAQLALLDAEFQDEVDRICTEYAALTEELAQLDADYLAAVRLPPASANTTATMGAVVPVPQFAAPVAPPTPYTARRPSTAAMWGMSSSEGTPVRPAAGLFTARMVMESPRQTSTLQAYRWPLGPGMETLANRPVSGGVLGPDANRRMSGGLSS
ncbi:hypothetical protein GGF31_006424 [Allomyces arbusculus]|nr:hypothetical protein GGF31_006424 [Allomyces arbusculus]